MIQTISDIQRNALVGLLREEQASCVVRRGDTIRIFRQRGVRDLYELVTCGERFLQGAAVADKVVGKGAAALMALGGVVWLHTEVVSTAALELLRRSGIEVEYGVEVPHIINRTGTGRCPVERLCEACATPEECLPKIEEFINKQ